jgi:hypothetical protein
MLSVVTGASFTLTVVAMKDGWNFKTSPKRNKKPSHNNKKSNKSKNIILKTAELKKEELIHHDNKMATLKNQETLKEMEMLAKIENCQRMVKYFKSREFIKNETEKSIDYGFKSNIVESGRVLTMIKSFSEPAIQKSPNAGLQTKTLPRNSVHDIVKTLESIQHRVDSKETVRLPKLDFKAILNSFEQRKPQDNGYEVKAPENGNANVCRLRVARKIKAFNGMSKRIDPEESKTEPIQVTRQKMIDVIALCKARQSGQLMGRSLAFSVSA